MQHDGIQQKEMKCIDCNQDTENGVICLSCDLEYDLNELERQLTEQVKFKEDMERKKRTNINATEIIDDVIADTIDEITGLYQQLENRIKKG